jgi:hypothetical protein
MRRRFPPRRALVIVVLLFGMPPLGCENGAVTDRNLTMERLFVFDNASRGDLRSITAYAVLNAGSTAVLDNVTRRVHILDDMGRHEQVLAYAKAPRSFTPVTIVHDQANNSAILLSHDGECRRLELSEGYLLPCAVPPSIGRIISIQAYGDGFIISGRRSGDKSALHLLDRDLQWVRSFARAAKVGTPSDSVQLAWGVGIAHVNGERVLYTDGYAKQITWFRSDGRAMKRERLGFSANHQARVMGIGSLDDSILLLSYSPAHDTTSIRLFGRTQAAKAGLGFRLDQVTILGDSVLLGVQNLGKPALVKYSLRTVQNASE